MSIGVAERKKLWGLARNECAFPSCSVRLLEHLADAAVEGNEGETGGTSGETVVIGEEAHIRSGQEGGPRYDANYDSKLIDTYENLILLCPTHHTLIDKDNGRGFSVRDLVKMRRGHEHATAREDRLQRAYAAYLADQWLQDNKVLFEAVELNGPSVESMFVDVPIAAPAGTAAGKTVAEIHAAAPVDIEARDSNNELEVAGGAQVLLSPLWKGNALIQGGPGQGKSTLLQYVCQFHRSRLAAGKDEHYTGGAEGLSGTTSVARLPIRIDLRRFAAWLKEQGATKPERDKGDRGRRREQRKPTRRPGQPPPQAALLPVFLAQHIQERSGIEFGPEDFATLLVERSVLLAFDGLDEIASLRERELASDIIVSSVPRLQANSLDLVVLVATRPGATDSTRWADADFTLLTLRPLSLGLKVQYLTRWCDQAGVSTERADDLREKLIKNQTVPHVRELGSNPMQLAILLHLLHRRGLLPQQRTELYRDYIKTFLDREEQDKEPLLSAHRKVIVEIHAFLAWYLQSRAETDENTAGALSRDELVRLVRERLSKSAEASKFADKLIAALTTRVLCLVERQPGFFEFEVQSLREYFAAFHIFEESPPRGKVNSRDDCLNALLERPYWSNVMRFMVGMLSKGEVKSLVDNLRSRTTGSDAKLDSYLRWVAVQFLDDRIYENQDDEQIAELIDFILEGDGALFSEIGLLDGAGLPTLFSEQAGASQAVEHAQRRLATRAEPLLQRRLATIVIRHSSDEEVRDWAWSLVADPVAHDDLVLLSDLGALCGLDAPRTSRLADALDRTQGPVLDLLSRGRWDGNDERIMNRVVGEVIDGGAESTTFRRIVGVASPLRSAIALGRLERLTGRSKLDSGGIEVQQSGRVRQRRRSGEVIRRSEAAHIQDWKSANDALATDAADEQRLKNLAAALRAIQPDSWLLRALFTFVAPTVDLSLGATPSLGDDTDSGWRAHAAWAREAHAHGTDSAWWTEQPIPLAGLPRRAWILAVACFAGTQQVLDLLSTLDQATARLSGPEYEAIRAMAYHYGQRTFARRLNLRDALRRKVEMSARTAALLTGRDPSSKEHLDRIILAGSLPIGVSSVGGESLQAAVASTTTPLDIRTLEGSGEFFPLGTLRHLTGKQLALSSARGVLEHPEHWPPDVVLLADRRIALKRANDLPPVAAIAEADNWFRAN